MSRRAIALVSALALLGIAGGVVASAASLSVNTSGTHVAGANRCTDGPLATTTGTDRRGANYRAVNVSGVPAECAGLPIDVVVYRSNGTSYATGSGTASAGSFDVATSNYHVNNVAGVALTIGGWAIPATWGEAPILPAASCIVLTSWTGGWPPPDTYGTPTGDTCTVTFSNYSEWGSPTDHFNFTFTVSGADNWRVTFNFANTDEFPGFTPTNVGGTLNPRLAPGADCSQLPVIEVQKYLPYTSDVGYIEANATSSNTQNQLCP